MVVLNRCHCAVLTVYPVLPLINKHRLDVVQCSTVHIVTAHCHCGSGCVGGVDGKDG